MTGNKHQKQKCSFSESFLIVASVFLLILLLHNSSIAGSAVAQALKICSTMLIPSLFPLMIASEIFYKGKKDLEYQMNRTLSSMIVAKDRFEKKFSA
jgi:hypothetical protein